jgi:hypothetical protein
MSHFEPCEDIQSNVTTLEDFREMVSSSVCLVLQKTLDGIYFIYIFIYCSLINDTISGSDYIEAKTN